MDAVFTRSSRLKNSITVIIKAEVAIMDIYGVLVFWFILRKKAGRRASLAIAMELLDAASIPALAVVTNASKAANASTADPVVPINLLAPREIGVIELASSSDFSNPTVMKITAAYKTITKLKARNIPSGMLRPGSFTSSAAADILVRPPKETKTTPAVAKTEPRPKGIKG